MGNGRKSKKKVKDLEKKNAKLRAQCDEARDIVVAQEEEAQALIVQNEEFRKLLEGGVAVEEEAPASRSLLGRILRSIFVLLLAALMMLGGAALGYTLKPSAQVVTLSSKVLATPKPTPTAPQSTPTPSATPSPSGKSSSHQTATVPKGNYKAPSKKTPAPSSTYIPFVYPSATPTVGSSTPAPSSSP